MTLTTPEEFEFMPGVEEALRHLHDTGLLIFVVTNQPDVARGKLDPLQLRRIHDRLAGGFPFDGIYTCLHDDPDNCDCRKPKPGLILRAAREFDIDPARGFMVGDHQRDVGAGRNAGCATILIRRPYSGDSAGGAQPDYIVRDLPDAAETIIRLCRPEPKGS